MKHLSETIKEYFDWGAFGTIGATFLQVVPDVSAVVGLFWLCLRVWEMDTVKGWRGIKQEKKNGNF